MMEMTTGLASGLTLMASRSILQNTAIESSLMLVDMSPPEQPYQLTRWFAGGVFQVTLQRALPLLIQPFLFSRGEVRFCPCDEFPKPFRQRQDLKGAEVFHHGQQFLDALPPSLLIRGLQGSPPPEERR
jgi:hypothetical protein